MTALWTALALAGAAALAAAVLYLLFQRKLAQGGEAWQTVGRSLGLQFTPVRAKIGTLQGEIDGLSVHIDIDNIEGFGDGIETYTRIRVALPLDAEAVQRAEKMATDELSAVSHGFQGQFDAEGALWLRQGIVFDPRTLEMAIGQALAAGRAVRR